MLYKRSGTQKLPQVKRHCGGCGSGGDWALRVSAARATDVPPQQPADDGTPPLPERLSLLFYLADEQVPSSCFM